MFDSLRKKISGFFQREEKVLEEKVAETEAIAEGAVEAEAESPAEKRAVKEEKREFTTKLSITTKIKKAVVRKATIKEKDVDSLLWDFNLALLESDVAVSVAETICNDIKAKLVGKEISGKQDISELTRDAIRSSLVDTLKQDKVDFIGQAKKKKPYIVLFLGPNGHGKSSTIGKVAAYLKKNGLSSVVSASDTFRAASIEQLEKIAGRAGVRVIKHKYGADPAAVAFDAIKHAEAHGIDVVLIDTAGRSELNVNLMEEMKKIVRVAKPDFKIYVGEALAGNAAVEEAAKFNDAIGIDGIIITKVDCDAKGGSLLSIAHVTKRPVVFIATGQGLDDLQEFEPSWFIDRILS